MISKEETFVRKEIENYVVQTKMLINDKSIWSTASKEELVRKLSNTIEILEAIYEKYKQEYHLVETLKTSM